MRIIHDNIEILSDFGTKSGCVIYLGAYYTRKFTVLTMRFICYVLVFKLRLRINVYKILICTACSFDKAIGYPSSGAGAALCHCGAVN